MLRPSLALALLTVSASSARAQVLEMIEPVQVAPAIDLLHARLASGDFNGDGALDLVVSGLDRTSGRPRVTLLRFMSASLQVVRGDTLYSVTYNQVVNQFGAAWGGDVLAHDLDGDGDRDLIYAGANDTTSASNPLLVAATQNNGVLSPASLPPLPAYAHARFAASGRYLAAMGRLADGSTSLVVLHRTQATGIAHTRVGTGRGADLGTLAAGDCDADGAPDFVATGLDVAGRPVATLLRNTGGGFTESTLPIVAVFNGDAMMRDLDGDGDDDLVVTGSVYGPMGTEGATRVYLAHNCTFTPVDLAPDLAHYEGTSLGLGDIIGAGNELLINGRDAGAIGGSLLFVPLNGLGTAPLSIRLREPGALNADLSVFDYDGNGLAEVIVVGTRESYSGDQMTLVPVVVLYRRPGVL